MPPFRPSNPTGPYLVKGISLGHGVPGIRQELREFKKNTDLWNLYLLGLWQFQLIPMEDQLSYFQIAAMLFVANQFTKKEGQERYLAAAKAFRLPFWDWARPDLPVFPDEATDSDVVRVVMPEELRKVYDNLKKETDGSVEIPNPLYAYKFQEGVKEIFKVHGLSTTTRYHSARTLTKQSPADEKKALISSLTPYTRDVNQQLPVEGNLRERVVYLIKSYEIFDQVSHNQWDPKRVPAIIGGKPNKVIGQGFGSFEDIHNTLHVLVGGSGVDSQGLQRTGHMRSVPISAFDPIFWLHHTNIDRLVSIWEGLHADPSKPESWVTTKKSDNGSWVTLEGDDEDLDTPLAPFYKDKDNFWTSDDVRDTTKFGYAYPETKSWSFANADDYRKDIEQKLRDLYPSGSLATMITASKAGDEQPEAILRRRAKKLARIDAVTNPSTALTALSLAKTASPTTESLLATVLPSLDVPNIQIPDGRSLANLAKGDTYLEWLVNIKGVKHTLGGEYLVHVFLGRVPPEEPTALYAVSPYHVGTFAPLGQSEDTACSKCRRDQAAGTEITGQIPLTIALAERYFAGELNSLQEEDVIKYLQMNLHWEVVNEKGQRLQSHRDLVEGLLVGVVSNEVTLPENKYEVPRYSPEITIYPEITTKEDGNSGRAEGTGVTKDNKYFN
ncbi:Di-copper centre-containing protein [Stipitochalara longipes BDJ]|nr:Di-copper centre-containing protein [Stipitochalara longipes BDJ]